MKRNLLYLLPCVLLLWNCEKSQKSLGDKTFQIFENQSVKFVDNSADSEEVIHLASGRMLLKKLDLPVYEKEVTATLRIALQSAGDRWDKSGSFFVIPKKSAVNFLSIARDSMKFPENGDAKYPGIIGGKDYLPAVELMRFMTPFGVGYYSEKSKRKPVYIPHFEKEVLWEQDVTDRISLLQGEVWVGVWIDTWTAEGYSISAELDFKETKAKDFPKKKSQITSLVNTVSYGFGQQLPDFFAHKDLKTSFEIPENAKNIRLNYIVTGHGGHSGGDEFTKQENKIAIDGKEIYAFVPWRDDCASFRRFNPSSGVWLIQDTASYIDFKKGKYAEKVIEERLASSDLSRSNWCPGSDVFPEVIPLDDLSAGTHTLTISVPNAQAAKDDELNHWLISAYLYWEK